MAVQPRCDDFPQPDRLQLDLATAEPDPAALAAVAATIPHTAPDTPQRLYAGLRRLAAAVKSHAHLGGADPDQLDYVALDWQTRTWGAGVWTRAELLATWRRVWADVECPIGCRPIDDLWRQAATLTPTPATLRYRQPLVRQLGHLCVLLQRRAGPYAPFFISTRTAGVELMGKSAMYASRALRLFREDGMLALISDGRVTRKASRYFHPSAAMLLRPAA
ncbi:MAG TPA: hypothetical protein VGF55_04405 [Gemmataceae bacterium]